MTGSKTWSMVKSLKRRDQTLTDQKDIANYFAEHFSKNSSSSNYDPRFARTKDNGRHSDTWCRHYLGLSYDFTAFEVTENC